MSATIVATTKGGSGTAISAAAVVTSSSALVGDVVIFAVASRTGATTSPLYPPLPTGVSSVGIRIYATVGRLDIFRKVVTVAGTETISLPFFAADGTTAMTAVHSWICVLVRGQTGEPAVLSAGVNGTTQVVTTAAVTTTASAELILRFVGGSVASGATDEKTTVWDSPVTTLATAQGTNGTGTGLSWMTASSEIGPTPGAAVAARTLTAENAPSTWGTFAVGVLSTVLAVDTDVEMRLSGGTGNAAIAASLGGAFGNAITDNVTNNLFDNVANSEITAGALVEYRCFYWGLKSTSPGPMTGVVLWISANTPATDTTVDIGVEPGAVNATAQTVANETTAPTSVTFTAPSTSGTGLALGDFTAGQKKAVWVRRTVNQNAAAASDSFVLSYQGTP